MVFGVIGVGIELLNGFSRLGYTSGRVFLDLWAIWRLIGCMRGASWSVLADLNPSWARSDGLAGLSWGPWALLWAKFGVWRVVFGGREGK